MSGSSKLSMGVALQTFFYFWIISFVRSFSIIWVKTINWLCTTFIFYCQYLMYMQIRGYVLYSVAHPLCIDIAFWVKLRQLSFVALWEWVAISRVGMNLISTGSVFFIFSFLSYWIRVGIRLSQVAASDTPLLFSRIIILDLFNL